MALLAVVPQGIHAQATGAEHVVVHGVVVDRETKQPVAAVLVRTPDDHRYTSTDSAGRFTLRLESGATVKVTLERLGYDDRSLSLEAARDTTLMLELAPEPIVLEGLAVVADRLAERRKRFPYPVDALTGPELLETKATDMYELIGRKLLHFVHCPSDRKFERPRCYRAQGITLKPILYVDDFPLVSGEGADDLRDFMPQDVAAVEVIANERIRQIRIYTKRFMKLVAANPRLLSPAIPIR